MHNTRYIALLLPFCLGACTLDAFVYNPRHCSTVGPSTCEDAESEWNKVCTPCDEDYDWGKNYTWIEGTLKPGQTVRAIDAATVKRISHKTKDGKATLDVYIIPSHGQVPALAQTTVLFNHGNFGGIEHYMPRLRFVHEAGYNIVVWDYRGYGKSEPNQTGTPDEFLSDAREIQQLAKTLSPDPQKIIVYANSLGTIPALEMAVTERPCALMLEVPFTSMAQIQTSNTGLTLPESTLSSGEYQNTEKIKSYDGPLLVMHGTKDTFFPLEDVRRFYDHAPGPKTLWVVNGAGHGIQGGGVPEAGLDAYFETMTSFLAEKAPGCLTENP